MISHCPGEFFEIKIIRIFQYTLLTYCYDAKTFHQYVLSMEAALTRHTLSWKLLLFLPSRMR